MGLSPGRDLTCLVFAIGKFELAATHGLVALNRCPIVLRGVCDGLLALWTLGRCSQGVRFVSACVLSVFATAAPAVAAEPARAEVVIALRQWRETFASLKVVYEVRNPQAAKRYFPTADDAALAAHFTRWTWHWSDIGATRMEVLRFLGDTNVPTYHELEGVDGSKSVAFRAVYNNDKQSDSPPFLKNLFVHPTTDSRPKSTTMMVPLFQLWSPSHGEWLDERLLNEDGMIEDLETRDNTKCVRLTVLDYRIWLDVDHSYLPRKVEWLKNGRSTAGWNHNVSEFQLVDGVAWFPKRGTYSFVGDPLGPAEWVVTEVKLNQPIESTAFAPPSPQTGTAVIDNRRGTTYIAGTAAADQKSAMKQAPTRARDRLSYVFVLPLVLVPLSALLLLVGWFVTRRERR